jgi:hypothetical protein
MSSPVTIIISVELLSSSFYLLRTYRGQSKNLSVDKTDETDSRWSIGSLELFSRIFASIRGESLI